MSKNEENPVQPIGMISVLDLRPYSRRSKKCSTKVYVHGLGSNPTLWIEAGEARLNMKSNRPGEADLSVYWDGVVDQDHKSAYILILPLIGIRLMEVINHTTGLEAWIDPNNFDGFRVPSPGYVYPGLTQPCKFCAVRSKHQMGPYIPPPNKELFREMRGRKVEIQIGPKD